MFNLNSGPNSIAKYIVQPLPHGIYRVNYTPVEVGIYNVVVKWNGHHVEGNIFDTTLHDVVVTLKASKQCEDVAQQDTFFSPFY
jgi:hypothetical protein